MSDVEVVGNVLRIIEAGNPIAPVESAEIIQFVSDNGANTWNTAKQTAQGTNGVGFNYWVVAAETLIGEVAYYVTAGAALLTMELPAAAALAVPALGVGAGVLLYEVSPEFWTRVSNALVNAGITIKGKVVSFLDKDGYRSFPPEFVQILADELYAEGVFTFEREWVLPDDQQSILDYPNNYSNCVYYNLPFTYQNYNSSTITWHTSEIYTGSNVKTFVSYKSPTVAREIWFSTEPFSIKITYGRDGVARDSYYRTSTAITQNNITYYWCQNTNTVIDPSTLVEPLEMITAVDGDENHKSNWDMIYIYFNGIIHQEGGSEYLEDGATYPDGQTGIHTLYPDWITRVFPEITDPSGDPWRIPMAYPFPYEGDLVDPNQEETQNIEEDPSDETTAAKILIEGHSHAQRINDPEEEPWKPEEEDDEEEDEGEEETHGEEVIIVTPDPIIPDPPDPITPIIIHQDTPDSLHSTKLFTVYNPTSAQLNSLGAYLWDSDIIDIIKKMWQNPMDGIISLIQVYATPATSGSSHIILGYLDSNVTAPVVSNQFVTLNCGSVNLPELNENATDYTPYTSISLYLPFIGIQELDVNECMKGSINVTYTVDVYTGTCLAEIKITRSNDLPNGAVLYTFSGNCSQQVPLTSGDAKGVLSALLSAAGAGVAVAAGGGLGVAAGALAIGQTFTQDMLHVNHSGGLTANAGIMGFKKPYLIITRQKPYTANAYNEIYGFPSNKTVYLGNCVGYTRVKDVQLRTSATDPEREEIIALLKEGVIM